MRKLNVTDGRTDRQTGGVAISPVPGPTAPAGDKKDIAICNGSVKISGVTMPPVKVIAGLTGPNGQLMIDTYRGALGSLVTNGIHTL